MKKLLIAVGRLALLLAGCASAPEPTPVPTSTFTPKPTSTRRIFPSPTRYKTQTPTPSLTPTITVTSHPTSTLLPYPTPENAVSRDPFSICPNKNWSAWQVNCNNQDFPTTDCFAFVNIDGTKSWPLSVEAIVPEIAINEYVSIAHWSRDNRFVYLVTTLTDVEWFFWTPVNSIIKFSLVNGLYSYIITPKFDPTLSLDTPFFQYAFSNNSQHLVYGSGFDQSINLTILNLYEGEVNYLSVIVNSDSPFGDFSWSPNDRFFVFSVAESVTGIYSSDKFSVFLVDIEELYAKHIYSLGGGWLSFPEWISDREVLYMYDSPGGSSKIILN